MLSIRENRIVSFPFVLFFSLIFVSPCKASSDIKQVTATVERKRIVENLNRQHENINSMTAKVYQRKHLSLLKKDIHMKGTIFLQKPDMLRWETVSPERSFTVIKDKTMTVFHPDVNEAELYKFSEHFMARNTMHFFSSVVWGSVEGMEKRFNVEVFRRNGDIAAELKPLSKMAARYLSSITIFYNEKTGLPTGFEVTTPKGDRTVTELTDLKVNPELRPDIFKIKLPPGVLITNRPESFDY